MVASDARESDSLRLEGFIVQSNEGHLSFNMHVVKMMSSPIASEPLDIAIL